MAETIRNIVLAAFCLIITLWMLIFVALVGLFLPFCFTVKLLFHRDVLKILKDGFKDSFD